MSDLISRCELFNRLATIPAPAEANELKAKVYEIIQSMDAADVLYVCDRNRCECCNPDCELTRDEHHAATSETAILADGVVNTIRGWIPCDKRLPDKDEVVLVCMKIENHKAEWEEQRSIEFGRISSVRYDYDGTGWEWLNESGADYWQADYNDSIIAWMPLPKPWKGADDEVR